MTLKVAVIIVMCSSGTGWGEGSHHCWSVAEIAIALLLIEVKNLMC